MEENTQLPKEELITEQRLKELGFEYVDYGDDPPYETYRKDGIEVSEYNGECWLIEMLDQNNIERPMKYLSELEAFFNGCGKSIYGATAYASKLHQADEKIKELERWKSEAKAIINPIWDYADTLKVPLGASKTEAVVKHANEAKELLNEVLLGRFGATLEFHNNELYNKVKAFLYGE